MDERRKPNLFVIGAMKSGTTYLNKLLNKHHAIFMCSPEEPSYFVDPSALRRIWPDAWDLGLWRDEEHYLRLFQSTGDAVILGEASTNYTKLPLVPGVAKKIHLFNPEARFIYIMRDPVERTISHYWHMVRYHAERRPMLDAIRAEAQYLDVSHYAMQLLAYYDLFNSDCIAVLTFEQLVGAPKATMRNLYRWLGLSDADVDVSGFDQPENVTPPVLRAATRSAALVRLRQSRAGRLLTPYLPPAIRAMGLRMATDLVDRRSIDTSEVTGYLRSIQGPQTDALVRLVGRDFPEWTTLHGAGAPSSQRLEQAGIYHGNRLGD